MFEPLLTQNQSRDRSWPPLEGRLVTVSGLCLICVWCLFDMCLISIWWRTLVGWQTPATDLSFDVWCSGSMECSIYFDCSKSSYPCKLEITVFCLRIPVRGFFRFGEKYLFIENIPAGIFSDSLYPNSFPWTASLSLLLQ